MEKKDIPSVLEIENQSFANPWREFSFIGEIDNFPISNPYVIIHRSEQKIIGYIIYWILNEEAQISNIAVHPHYRKSGIAENVLCQVMDELRNRGVKYVVLEVRPSNQAARFLYNKLGFKVIGVKKGYYHNPSEDALIMGKSVEDS
ncbi:ribosomal protein S18-alanine N-acetyltransferase [bacterium]|nr:ribosomal protein S18-alanine N-acetyltransferase [bacterium]